MRDAFGLDVALDDPEAVARWNETMIGVLAHCASTPGALAAVLERAPDFALAHACHGLFCLILARRELVDQAADDFIAACEAASPDGSDPRTRGYVEALGDWLAGHPSRAADRLEAIASRFRGDALAAKLTHAIRFMIGDAAGMRRAIEAVIADFGDDHPGTGYMHGCHAFALEETGEYAAAESAGRRATELAVDDAWGVHAVAHVYDMTARPREGVSWLASRPQAWSHCNNFRYHVWWHLALHHIDLGETGRALDLYDTRVRRDHTDDFRDIANGASLLARLAIEGADIGNRWDELADIAERRLADGCLVFADLHYLMSLLGAGRHAAAGRLVERIACAGERAAGEMDGVARHPGIAAARGLEALWSDRPHTALEMLMSARAALQSIGGSNAQRDVFERLTIEAAIRARAPHVVRRLIEERLVRRGSNDRFARRCLGLIGEACASSEVAGGNLAPA